MQVPLDIVATRTKTKVQAPIIAWDLPSLGRLQQSWTAYYFSVSFSSSITLYTPSTTSPFGLLTCSLPGLWAEENAVDEEPSLRKINVATISIAMSSIHPTIGMRSGRKSHGRIAYPIANNGNNFNFHGTRLSNINLKNRVISLVIRHLEN